jgi:hypothetical protein
MRELTEGSSPAPARRKELASYRQGAMTEKKSKKREPSDPDYPCRAAISLISNYLVGSIAPSVRVDFERHLSFCPDCAAFLQTYKKTIEVTREFLRSQTPKLRSRGIQRLEKHGRSLAALALWVHLFLFNMSLIVE